MTLRLLLEKDLRLLFRSPKLLISSFGFALLLVVVGSFSFRAVGYGVAELRSITPGVLWLVFLFCSVSALNSSLLFETRDRALYSLLLTKAAPWLVYVSKTLSNFLLLTCLQVFVVFTHGILFGAESLEFFYELFALSLLGAFGVASLGTLLSSIAVTVQGRDILLPLILFPMLVPFLSGLVFLTRETMLGGGDPFAGFWFHLIVVYDLIAFSLGVLLFEHIVFE